MQTLNELRRKLKYHKTISKDLEEQKICDLRSILEFTESMLAEKVTKLGGRTTRVSQKPIRFWICL